MKFLGNNRICSVIAVATGMLSLACGGAIQQTKPTTNPNSESPSLPSFEVIPGPRHDYMIEKYKKAEGGIGTKIYVLAYSKEMKSLAFLPVPSMVPSDGDGAFQLDVGTLYPIAPGGVIKELPNGQLQLIIREKR